MAASRAANVLQKDHLNISVLFAKLVTPDKLGSLIVEIVKYILYEREQLPMPYDNFRKHVDRIAGTSANKAMLNVSAHRVSHLTSLRGISVADNLKSKTKTNSNVAIDCFALQLDCHHSLVSDIFCPYKRTRICS